MLTVHIMPVSIGTILMTDLNSALTAGLVPVANAIQTLYTIQQPFIAEFSISRLGDGPLVPRNELAGTCEMSTLPDLASPSSLVIHLQMQDGKYSGMFGNWQNT